MRCRSRAVRFYSDEWHDPGDHVIIRGSRATLPYLVREGWPTIQTGEGESLLFDSGNRRTKFVWRFCLALK
jgi:hypothetical protein